MQAQVPPRRSIGEATLELHLRSVGIEFLTEHVFHPVREWRLDFAIGPTTHKIAIEVDGLTKTGGRHQTLKGYTEDCVKTNAAVELGWTVLRYTTRQVKSGAAIEQINRVLARRQVAAIAGQ